MSPVFPIKTLFMLALPIAIAAAVLAAAGKRGLGVFKKQGVAWGLTALMIFAAIGIGYAKAPYNNPAPEPGLPSQTVPPTSAPIVTAPPAASNSCVWDNARVLSDRTVRKLDERNERLWKRHGVTIGVVTCNYGGDDLYDYALQCAGDMGLGGCDFIVALDISGENYWLVQGADMTRDFTDQDCSDYAYDYMEDYFARGMYDDAVLALTEALEDWYGSYYG